MKERRDEARGLRTTWARMKQAIDNIPDRTATKVVGEVSNVVKEEANGIKQLIDQKFEQIFGKGPREGETHAETKQRFKHERALQDEVLNNTEKKRKIEQAAEDKKQRAEERNKQRAEAKKQRAEDMKKRRAEDKEKAETAVNEEEAVDKEEAAIDREEIAKARKKAAEDKKEAAKAKAKGKAKRDPPMPVEH